MTYPNVTVIDGRVVVAFGPVYEMTYDLDAKTALRLASDIQTAYIRYLMEDDRDE